MTKEPYISDRHSTKGGDMLGRGENVAEDDRSFAEIRMLIHDALRILSLHRWAFFIPFSLVTCSAFIGSLYLPRTYRATTSFERTDDPVMMNLPLSNGASSYKYFRNTMVRDLTSVECMEEVIDNLGLTKDYERTTDGALTPNALRQRALVAHSLTGTIGVTTTSPSEQIDVIMVTYTGSDPKIGRALVDEVKRTYIRRTMAWIYDFLTGQREYFTKEAEEALVEVNAARRVETKLRLDNPHVDPTNPGAIALKLSQLEMEHRELNLRNREYQAELSALQQMLAANAPDTAMEEAAASQGAQVEEKGVVSPQALQLAAELQVFDEQIAELRTKRGMTEQHPDIQSMLARREKVAENLEAQRERDRHAVVANIPIDTLALNATVAMNSSFDPVQAERARLMVQIAALKSKLKDVEIGLESNNVSIDELRTAKREVFQKQEAFADIMGQVAQSRQQHERLLSTLASIEPAIKAIEQGRLLQFSEGQPARGSDIPVSPKSMTVIFIALCAGVAAGFLFVMLAEVFDSVFRSSNQVAKALGLPILEAIDEIVTSQDRRSIFFRRVVIMPVITLTILLLTGLAGSMAFLSIERPTTYQKIRMIPDEAIRLFAGDTTDKSIS